MGSIAMLRLVLPVSFAVMTTLSATAQVFPSGNLSQDCAIELKRYCAGHLNPSAHRMCLETQVPAVGPLCQASMDRNGVKRRR